MTLILLASGPSGAFVLVDRATTTELPDGTKRYGSASKWRKADDLLLASAAKGLPYCLEALLTSMERSRCAFGDNLESRLRAGLLKIATTEEVRTHTIAMMIASDGDLQVASVRAETGYDDVRLLDLNNRQVVADGTGAKVLNERWASYKEDIRAQLLAAGLEDTARFTRTRVEQFVLPFCEPDVGGPLDVWLAEPSSGTGQSSFSFRRLD